MRPPRSALALLVVAAVFVASGAARAEPSWATVQAAEMTRQGRDNAARGEASVSARRYLDAIAFDPTYAPAYLALGELHEATGDPAEAERAYSVGIDHVPGWTAGLRARARLRARLGRRLEAVRDLEAAASSSPEDGALLVELEEAYVASGALPPALAVARRRAALAAASPDRGAAQDARVRVRALALLVGDVDPVAAGERDRGLVRSALARLARRR